MIYFGYRRDGINSSIGTKDVSRSGSFFFNFLHGLSPQILEIGTKRMCHDSGAFFVSPFLKKPRRAAVCRGSRCCAFARGAPTTRVCLYVGKLRGEGGGEGFLLLQSGGFRQEAESHS